MKDELNSTQAEAREKPAGVTAQLDKQIQNTKHATPSRNKPPTRSNYATVIISVASREINRLIVEVVDCVYVKRTTEKA